VSDLGGQSDPFTPTDFLETVHPERGAHHLSNGMGCHLVGIATVGENLFVIVKTDIVATCQDEEFLAQSFLLRNKVHRPFPSIIHRNH
jgi:hypothetical protein